MSVRREVRFFNRHLILKWAMARQRHKQGSHLQTRPGRTPTAGCHPLHLFLLFTIHCEHSSLLIKGSRESHFFAKMRCIPKISLKRKLFILAEDIFDFKSIAWEKLKELLWKALLLATELSLDWEYTATQDSLYLFSNRLNGALCVNLVCSTGTETDLKCYNMQAFSIIPRVLIMQVEGPFNI